MYDLLADIEHQKFYKIFDKNLDGIKRLMTEVKVPCISNKSKLIFKNVKNTKYIQHKVYLQHHLSNLEVFQVDFEDGTPFWHLTIWALKSVLQNQNQILYKASYLVFSMQKQRKIVQDKTDSKIWLRYKKQIRHQAKAWLMYYMQKHDNIV